MIFNYTYTNTTQYPFFLALPTPYFFPAQNNEYKQQETKSLNSNDRTECLSGWNSEKLMQKNQKAQKPLERKNKSFNRKKNKKRPQQNEEYIPEEQAAKNLKEKGKQNTMRNILPNIMHQTCTFVQKKSRSGHYVQQLLKRLSSNEYSVERFYLYQGLIKQKNNHYINQDAFKDYSIYHEPEGEIFSLEEQKEYLRISRILMRHFLTNDLRVNVLTSNRMKQETKNGHLKILRRIIDKLSSIYCQ